MKLPLLKCCLLVSVCCLVLPLWVSGEDDDPASVAGGKRANRQAAKKGGLAKLDEVLAKVGLTDFQKKKVEECKEKFRQFLQAQAEEQQKKSPDAAAGAADPQKRRDTARVLKEKKDELEDCVRALLTDDQKKIFDVEMPPVGVSKPVAPGGKKNR